MGVLNCQMMTSWHTRRAMRSPGVVSIVPRRYLERFRTLKFSIERPNTEELKGSSTKELLGTNHSPKSIPGYYADFFQYQPPKPRVTKTLKPQVIAPKSLLPFQENHTFPYKDFPADLPTPYEVMNQRKILKTDGPERLSVTSLSKGWCELRKLYDIYSSFQVVQTQAMREGTKIHESLETISHPKIDTAPLATAFILEAEKTGSSLAQVLEEGQDVEDYIDTLLASDPLLPVAEQVTRLLSLFTTGSCREIRVLAFVDTVNLQLVDASSDVDTDNLVMVSGIIDHLILSLSEDPEDFQLQEELSYYQNDLNDFFKQAPEILKNSPDWPSIMVSDVKTRGWRSLPKQTNVIRSNEFQTLSYRKLLGMMGGQSCADAKKLNNSKTLEFCYYSLVENFKRRNFAVDAPVSPELILHLLIKNPCLIPDAIRLKNGVKTGFSPFDNFTTSEINYDLSDLEGIRNYDSAYSILDEELFDGPWKRPMTIKFMCYRMAQFFGLMEPYLSDKCSIEYLVRQGDSLEPFWTTYHEYNNNFINKGLKHSIDFYLSKNSDKVDLISPETFSTYCEPSPNSKVGGCRYREWCGWYQENKQAATQATV